MGREETFHLRPTAPLAERVLLPGDPGRALLIAQSVLSEPKMFNHHRGLWGYTGTAPDGRALSVQSTGMGGPSAAIVIEELVRLGARNLLRVGTCGALAPDPQLGDLIVVREALTADGTSALLAPAETVRADEELTAALAEAAGPEADIGLVASSDLFYDDDLPTEERAGAWAGRGALAVDMETATLLALAARRGVRAAAVLAVTDLIVPGHARRRLDEEAIEAAGERLGLVGSRALGAAPAAV